MKDFIKKNRAFLGFLLLMLALGVSDSLRGVFSPIFTAHYSLSAAKLSQIVTVSYVGNLVFLLIGGRLTDRLPKKTAMIGMLSLWMCALLIFLFTDSFPGLLIGMFLAMGASTLLNTTMNLATGLLFASAPGFAVNFLFFVQGIGTSGSQSIIGNLATGISTWKQVNLILLGIGIVTWILFLCSRIPNWSAVKGEKIPIQEVWKNKAFLPLASLLGLYAIAEHGIMNWLIIYARDGLGVEQGTASNVAALFFGSIMIGRLVLSPLVDKLGLWKSLTLFGIAATCLYCIGVILGGNGLFLLGISGLFFSILYPSMVMAIPKLWSAKIVSTASGFVLSVASLADILFNSVFGTIVDVIGYRSAFLILPASMLLFAFGLTIFCSKIKNYLPTQSENL